MVAPQLIDKVVAKHEHTSGQKVHDLRSYLGLSLRAFGEPIGYTGMHISRFEKNVLIPDERVIQKICEVFTAQYA